MEYIREAQSIEVTSKAGNKKVRKQGIFICPACLCEVQKEYTNGIKAVSCGGSKCKDTKPTARYHHTQPYYNSWSGMKARCSDLHDEYYGGKGITYSIEWESFDNFWEDMRDTWFLGSEIERIEKAGNYCKENCEWITKAENIYRAHHRPVNKINVETGKIVKMYPSVTAAVDAGEACNTSQISRVARGERPTHLGFAWAYPTEMNKRKEYPVRPKMENANASNPMYTCWGNIRHRNKGNIQESWAVEKGDGFRSFCKDMGATYFEGAYLIRVDKTKPFTKDNCKWETKEKSTGLNRQRIVLQIDKQLGHIVREWASIKEAAISLSIDPSSMTKVCKGKKKSAGGFVWQYKLQ